MHFIIFFPNQATKLEISGSKRRNKSENNISCKEIKDFLNIPSEKIYLFAPTTAIDVEDLSF